MESVRTSISSTMIPLMERMPGPAMASFTVHPVSVSIALDFNHSQAPGSRGVRFMSIKTESFRPASTRSLAMSYPSRLAVTTAVQLPGRTPYRRINLCAPDAGSTPGRSLLRNTMGCSTLPVQAIDCFARSLNRRLLSCSDSQLSANHPVQVVFDSTLMFALRFTWSTRLVRIASTSPG